VVIGTIGLTVALGTSFVNRNVYTKVEVDAMMETEGVRSHGIEQKVDHIQTQVDMLVEHLIGEPHASENISQPDGTTVRADTSDTDRRRGL